MARPGSGIHSTSLATLNLVALGTLAPAALGALGWPWALALALAAAGAATLSLRAERAGRRALAAWTGLLLLPALALAPLALSAASARLYGPAGPRSALLVSLALHALLRGRSLLGGPDADGPRTAARRPRPGTLLLATTSAGLALATLLPPALQEGPAPAQVLASLLAGLLGAWVLAGPTARALRATRTGRRRTAWSRVLGWWVAALLGLLTWWVLQGRGEQWMPPTKPPVESGQNMP